MGGGHNEVHLGPVRPIRGTPRKRGGHVLVRASSSVNTPFFFLSVSPRSHAMHHHITLQKRPSSASLRTLRCVSGLRTPVTLALVTNGKGTAVQHFKTGKVRIPLNLATGCSILATSIPSLWRGRHSAGQSGRNCCSTQVLVRLLYVTSCFASACKSSSTYTLLGDGDVTR